MGTHNVRLGCQLVFDEEQEKDIIDAVHELTSSHKLGQFISNVLRLAFDNPEVIEVKNGKTHKGTVLKAMEACGLTYDRNKYINQLNREIMQLKKKVDSIYEMSMKMYMLGLMNKHIGIEQKADNMMQASFILEKQLRDIQNKLGVSKLSDVYASNKLDRAHDLADEAMEFIIEAYDGIITELKETVVTGKEAVATGATGAVASVPKAEATKSMASGAVESVTEVMVGGTTSRTAREADRTVREATKTVVAPSIKPNTVDEDDEVIDFGDTPESNADEEVDFSQADFGALSNFFSLN